MKMASRFSLFYKSIPAKLFLMNALTCTVFILIEGTVFFSFPYVEKELTRIFSGEIQQVIGNSVLGRELTRVIADTNFLMSRFYGREDILSAEGERLRGEIAAIMAGDHHARIKSSLGLYEEKVRNLLGQCEQINQARRDIEAADQKISTLLAEVNDIVSKKIRDKIIEGKDASVMEQLTFMISGYREILPQIAIYFAKADLRHFESPMEQKAAHPMLALTDDLRLRLRTLTSPDPDILSHGKQIRAEVDHYRELILEFHFKGRTLGVAIKEMNQAKETLLVIMSEMEADIARSARQGEQTLKDRIAGGILKISLFTLLVMLTVTVFTYLLSRAVTKSVRGVIRGLEHSSGGVITAAGHVSSSSQGLSQGTSEQAAFLQQTSAALEQMNEKVRQNADNAVQSWGLANHAVKNIESANMSMTRLLQFMEDITTATRKIQTIIKLIDELSFQTNLVALNASIESARAGEAGAGFSIVADEVRNLAVRSSEALCETSDIIEETVGKVTDGAKIVSEVNETFSVMELDTLRIGKMVKAVANDSDEQAMGISEINRAVGEVDKVIQNLAAGGEQLAGTAQEMKTYAGSMNSFVLALTKLLGKT
ncbi:Methyl-accepting chemotaxis protein domain-containing protein [Desulfonema magnum]|uniref:Methyl-accepting chemotaxis protein domain-containing protein n=2 Tax=Desulfonema magnum TaxID=45655 RepID=A0A975GLB8_9BACT|nr:Methyl-accepting chemotaxis protein domain-containing protein [Desulfonema magnum]